MAVSTQVSAFLAALRPEHREGWEPSAVDALVELAWSRGQADWPALEVERTALSTWLAERVDAAAGPASARGLELGALYLTCACVHGSDRAVAAFRDAYGPDVDVALRRLGLPAAAADDVRQAVLSKLFVAGSEKIRGYGGRGALGGWVRAVTVRQAISMGRRRAPLDQAQDEVPAQIPGLVDHERDYLQARYGAELREALGLALRELTPEDRNLLRFRFVEGLTLDELARVFDVHRATIARRLARARGEVRRATLCHLQAHLPVDGPEMESLVRLVRSQLDLSLTGLLATSPR